MISRLLGCSRAAWAGLAVATVSLLVCSPAGGQQGTGSGALTLADARERARATSPLLDTAREAVAAARGQERQAGAFLNPSFTYSHEQTSRGGETNSEAIASVQQPLEIAGQRGLRREASRLRREAAEAQLRTAELALDFEVARAYALALAAERKATHAREVAEAFAGARETSAKRREQGDVSGYEDRRMALEAARYAALRADAERGRRATRSSLATLLAPSPSEAPLLEGTLEGPLDVPAAGSDLAQMRETALERHPAIRSAEQVRRALEVEAQLAQREVVPDPTFALGYKREKMAGVPGSWNGFTAELNVPVPVWDRSGGAVAAAAAKARGSTADLRHVRRRIALDVERAWIDMRAASEQIEAIRPQLGPNSERALRAATAAYKEGEIALVELLDAVRAYFEAESTYADLLADHFIRRAELERAVGGSLF